ncbi:STAS domain-containing protein [Actinomadura barringtoniae]|uniref:Anti-sigma factor antagonist n=1 Tax=Actinomadura barringtoniae TaxID=1427535 RepID=A0A939T277_9ACTN|nr:STAS domain-containing protein [Actinomadura barringtoniae]MBO2449121.1 STAS domain-containing protein [Actinomadura barringtoniae]
MRTEAFRTEPEADGSEQWQVVEMAGELDIAQAGSLRRTIDSSLTRQARPRLALDLGDVTFCDSYGLSVLVYTAKKVRERDGDIVLAATSRQVRSLIKRCGLESLLPLPI